MTLPCPCGREVRVIAEWIIGAARYVELEAMSNAVVRMRREDFERIRAALKRKPRT